MEKEELQQKVEANSKKLLTMKKEVQKGIVGQDKVVDSVLK
jgi:ATP-dependent Clp protease ATP-binding subunit ClpA